jgi:hypothetical protein
VKLQEFLAHLAREPDWCQSGPIPAAARAGNGDTPLHASIWPLSYVPNQAA